MTTRPARDAIYWLAIIAAAVTIALTGAAFWLSYAHLAEVAGEHGLAAERKWAWPGTLDAFIVIGELLVLRGSLRGRIDWWAIALTATGSLGSIALNVAGVYRAGAPFLDYVVAGVPPVAALLAFGALMQQIHGVLAARIEVTRPQHVICAGRSGVLFLRRPFPPPAAPAVAPPATPMAPIDAAIEEAMRTVAADTEGVALLSVADVAAAKGVAEGTVRSWVNRNKLQPVRRDDDGRLQFHPAAVAALD